MSLSWRIIDIDQYDEDAYTEDEILAEFETSLSTEEVNSNTQKRGTEVRNLLTRGDLDNSLIRALEDPPYGRHLEEAKTESTRLVSEVLTLFRATDISNIIKTLNKDQQDILMKYLYAGMAKPDQYNSSLTEVAGTGCIVRVMTDKRSVF
ncbi:actin-related protein 2/3 complex subunit 5 [Pilobolus umbonatus]|nr:actin-related protein 2/3 complex subunit 5 [Pilobolus umbonatus]